MSVADLTAKFPVAGVKFTETTDGLAKAIVSRGTMSAELVLQGATVTAWQPAGGHPVIFTSSRAVFAPGKAIRGGVPIIFPWFGPHPTDPKQPQHGVVRVAPWQLDKVEAGTDAVTFELSFAAAGGFALTYRVAFGAELGLSLAARNTGGAPARFEEALHTYFAVSDVEGVSVSGLEACTHIDKTANFARIPPSATPVTLSKETDSVYLSVPGPLTINDHGWSRKIVIDKTGAASAIVWNPWPQKAAAMSDLGVDNQRGFICVETGNVSDNSVEIAAGATHEMTTRIGVNAA